MRTVELTFVDKGYRYCEMCNGWSKSNRCNQCNRPTKYNSYHSYGYYYDCIGIPLIFEGLKNESLS